MKAAWPVLATILGVNKEVDMMEFHILYIVCAPWNTPLAATWRREEAEEILKDINRNDKVLAERYPYAACTKVFPDQCENYIRELQGPALIGLFEEHGKPVLP